MPQGFVSTNRRCCLRWLLTCANRSSISQHMQNCFWQFLGLCRSLRKYAFKRGLCTKLCKITFIKHVLPMLHSPRMPWQELTAEFFTMALISWCVGSHSAYWIRCFFFLDSTKHRSKYRFNVQFKAFCHTWYNLASYNFLIYLNIVNIVVAFATEESVPIKVHCWCTSLATPYFAKSSSLFVTECMLLLLLVTFQMPFTPAANVHTMQTGV